MPDLHYLKRLRTWVTATLATVLVGSVVAGGALLLSATPAAASSGQVSIMEVPNIQYSNPAFLLPVLRSLGVNMLRLPVVWSSVAPDPSSRTAPNFNAADPSAYPAANWAPYDAVVQDAAADGVAVDLMPTGDAPLWATAQGAPPCSTVGGTVPVCFQGDFFPSASAYGQFVHAVARRYHSVRFWELWNEANWGPSLTPQYDRSSVPVSARIYRGLLDAGWSALRQTGHGQDTIVSSSLSQDGSASVGESGTSAPLTFIRTLYCLNSSYKQLRGASARQAGCPISARGHRRFRSANPGLFKVTGQGIHPYPYGHPPTRPDHPNRNGAEFAEIPHLISTIDRVQGVYGSRARMKIYNTEYGYQLGFVNAQNAARYLNEAEYLSWKNPRIGSYDQFELWDASWFPTGLLTATYQPKLSFYAYRLPIWLPVTRAGRGRGLEVWGDVRPAHFASADSHQPQYVLIQFSAGGTHTFRTVRRVRIRNSRGYFDVRVRFPSSGTVQLAWQYPAGDARLRDPLDTSQWIYSRRTSITLR